ncbi:YjdF family protein [Ectobacillus polymachus]|uniref:YjdF family protein n=1 Tax=Ectobacillus polymachus TaxID=1508806 RepID=UPI003A8A904F
MILTIFHDGQFWVGVIEMQESGRLKVYRYVFGMEPNDAEVLDFVKYRLPSIIESSKQMGIQDEKKQKKRMNPKRLQRQVAKEMSQKGISTKAQEAMKEAIEQRKVEGKIAKKHRDDAFKKRKLEIKKQKAKQKHRGH